MADRTVSVRLQLLVDQYKANAEGAAQATRKISNEGEKAGNVITRSIGGATKAAGLVSGAAAAGVTALGVSAAKTGTAYNTIEQTARAAFKTVLGSGAEANKMMEKVAEFAKTSPFPRQAFIQATQQMIGFGVAAEDVVPALSAIQDTVAAAGKGADEITAITDVLSRLQSQGRLSGEALERLGYYGVDAAKIIGEQTGKTAAEIKDMASKPGGIPVEKIWDPLVTGLTDNFGGAAENVKNTWVGATDRIAGAWRDISSKIAEPFVQKGGGGLALDWANAMADAMRAVEAKTEPTVDLIMKRLNPSLQKVEPVIRKIESGINGIDLRELDAQLDKLGKYGPAIGGVAAGIAAMGTQIGPLKSLGVAINPAVAGITALVALSPELRGAFGEFMDGLKPLLPVAQELGLTLLDVATSVLQTLSPALGDLLRTVGEVAASLGTGLGQAAITVVRALQPAAEVVATLLEVVSDIPGPVIAAAAAFGALQYARGPITGLVTSMQTLGQEMRLHQSLAAMSGQQVGAMGSAMSVAQGKVVGLGNALKTAFISNPIGLAVTGITMVIGGLVAAQASAAAKTQEHKQQVQNLTGALIESNGQLTENVRQQMAQQVADQEGTRTKKDSLALVRELGIAQGEFTDAILNGGDAQQQLRDQLMQIADANKQVIETGNGPITKYNEQGKAALDLVNILDEQAGVYGDSQQAQADYARENGTTTGAIENQNRALDENIKLQKEQAGNNLSQAQAELRYQETLAATTEKIKENGKNTDITTKAGQENQQALLDQASSHQTLIDSMQRNNASSGELTAKMKELRQDFIKNAEAAGYTADEAKSLADKYGLIPDSVLTKAELEEKDAKDKIKRLRKQLKDLEDMDPTPQVKAGIADVKRKIKEAEDDLNGIDGKTATVKIKLVTEGNIRNMPENLLNPNRKQQSAPGVEKKATGGAITGPGTGTSDSILMFGSNGEHVLTAREVDLLGGQSEAYRLREAIRAGTLPAFAKGGEVKTAENRVGSAEKSLRSARRSKQDAKSKSAKSTATARVRAAEDELAAARKSLKAAKTKASADERAAKEAKKRADEAKRLAAQKRKEEAERRERVGELRTDLRTDVRRGNIRDQVTGGLSGGYSAVDRLFGLGSNNDLSKASRSKANSSARKFEANLRSLYAQAEKIDDRLKKAQDKAQELKGIKDSVASSLLGGRDLDVGTYQTRVNGQWQSQSNLGQAAKGLRMDVGAMKAFAGKLKKLTELGIPGAIIQEIAQAGVEEGSNMADSFIGATAAERKSYLGAWSDYEKYANQAGQYVTEGFYKGGSAAADGVVKGLEGKQKNVEAAIANLAKTMESTFKQVLGIHSPSRVMSELGGFTAEGLVQGMLGGVTDVQSAAAALGSAAVPNMMAFQPDMSMDVGVNPVVADDEGMAGLAMQDMSTTTLEAMQAMGVAVSDGFAGMLANTQAAQAQMLLDTQLNQTGMLTATQAANLGQLTDTQVQHAAMLLDTQTQQEAMRATVLAKQTGQRTAATEQQELMRLMLIDKQSQMMSKSATDFESLKSTTGTKFSDMRKNTDGTMSGMYKDYDTRLVDLKGLNKRGFESLLSTSNSNMEGIKDGIDGKMGEAKPVLGNRLNALIGVLSSFTASVNKAFGDVGVKLDAPKSLKFADGGVMPGYTPGRDVHHFRSASAGDLYLSGGEGIIRPETVRMIGGEKGVHALNAAARRGDSDSVTHMLGGMAFANGGVVPRIPGVNAFADAGVWRNLWAITRDQFPNARLTSAYRGGSRTVSGNASYHSRGMAIDVSPSMDIFNFWRNKYGANLAELIYSPANGKQIKNGSNHYYTGAVRGMHFNHVHIAARQALSDAMAGGLPGMGGEMSHPFLDRAGVKPGDNLAKSYAQAAQKLTAQIYSKHSKDLPDGIAGQLGKGIMSQVSEGLIGKAKEYGKTTAVSGTTAGDPAVKAAVRKIAEQMGWGKYWGDIDWLVNKESSWNPNAANPSSSARGLFQKMTSLHGPVEDTVEGQARWGLNYIKSTYGNPAKARAHHQRSNWYEGGSDRAKRGLAVVGEQGPELVNFRGGEQVMSTADSMKFMAANRTYIPTSGTQFDQAAFTNAVAQAVQANGINPNDLADALSNMRITFNADGQQFTGAVTAVVGSGYDQSRSRLSKSSQKIGAR